jgi:hypothetical protein
MRFSLLLRYLDTCVLNCDSRQPENDVKALKSAYKWSLKEIILYHVSSVHIKNWWMYPVHRNKFIVTDSIHLSAFRMIYHNGMNSTKKKKVQFLGGEPFIFFNPIGWMDGNSHSPQLTWHVALHESSVVTERQKGANFFMLVTDTVPTMQAGLNIRHFPHKLGIYGIQHFL